METAYVVLRRTNRENIAPSWEEFESITATSAGDAVKKVAEAEGIYVAVPARSWKPITVKVETKKVVSLG